jgi:hypothetical protein
MIYRAIRSKALSQPYNKPSIAAFTAAEVLLAVFNLLTTLLI